MAPEVLSGKKATPGSDLYMLGITVYELLTGCTSPSSENEIPRKLSKVYNSILNFIYCLVDTKENDQ